MSKWERLMKGIFLQKMVTKKRVVWNVLWQIHTSVSFMLSGGSRYSNSNDKHPLLRQRGTRIEKEIYLKYYRKSTLNILWKDWCWSWSSNTLTTWYEELTHWKRPWCGERLRARRKEGNGGWNDWMTLTTQWTWVWANSGRQGSLACCSPRSCKESDMIWPLNNNNNHKHP